jgi:hypothetical protein
MWEGDGSNASHVGLAPSDMDRVYTASLCCEWIYL